MLNSQEVGIQSLTLFLMLLANQDCYCMPSYSNCCPLICCAQAHTHMHHMQMPVHQVTHCCITLVYASIQMYFLGLCQYLDVFPWFVPVFRCIFKLHWNMYGVQPQCMVIFQGTNFMVTLPSLKFSFPLSGCILQEEYNQFESSEAQKESCTNKFPSAKCRTTENYAIVIFLF